MPLDLVIFLRSGSSTQPEMAAVRNGIVSFRKWLNEIATRIANAVPSALRVGLAAAT